MATSEFVLPFAVPLAGETPAPGACHLEYREQWTTINTGKNGDYRDMWGGMFTSDTFVMTDLNTGETLQLKFDCNTKQLMDLDTGDAEGSRFGMVRKQDSDQFRATFSNRFVKHDYTFADIDLDGNVTEHAPNPYNMMPQPERDTRDYFEAIDVQACLRTTRAAFESVDPATIGKDFDMARQAMLCYMDVALAGKKPVLVIKAKEVAPSEPRTVKMLPG